MRETDVKPDIPRRKKFHLLEVAELIAEVERLKPKFVLLSRKDAAEYINTATRGAKSYTPKALANLASRGMGPPYLKLGNEAYYLEHDLNAWILSKRIVPMHFYDGQWASKAHSDSGEGQ
ncbi:MAG: hypothetical protein AAGB04_20925 [Pseudomonadota bacterium]